MALKKIHVSGVVPKDTQQKGNLQEFFFWHRIDNTKIVDESSSNMSLFHHKFATVGLGFKLQLHKCRNLVATLYLHVTAALLPVVMIFFYQVKIRLLMFNLSEDIKM